MERDKASSFKYFKCGYGTGKTYSSIVAATKVLGSPEVSGITIDQKDSDELKTLVSNTSAQWRPEDES